jgi:hypothetical protein
MILLQGIFSSSFSTFLAIDAAKRIMRLYSEGKIILKPFKICYSDSR